LIDSPLLDRVSKYNVSWTTSSQDENGSMPLGNGETGINVWVEPSGDILLYISRTDSWDENERLCKLGRIRLKLLPQIPNSTILTRLKTKQVQFSQTLDLIRGEILILFKDSLEEYSVRIWINAEHQAIHLDFMSSKPCQPQIELELWRDSNHSFKPEENHCVYGSKENQLIYPDTILTYPSKLMWYHKNTASPWQYTLKHQFLEDFIPRLSDPLVNRIFGAQIEGIPSDQYKAINSKFLKANTPIKESHIVIFTHTESNSAVNNWEQNLTKLNEEYMQGIIKNSLLHINQVHQNWWKNFWLRSYIFIAGNISEYKITQSYVLQRFMHAIGGRGNFPIKFNGSIYTVMSDPRFDPDYRRWGGGYWFQNTRLPYWGMFASQDWDFFEPMFRMYLNTKELGEWRTKKYYHHEGWFFPETMSFWGTYLNENFGWDWSNKKIGDPIDNPYIRYHFNGTLELLTMAIVYYQYTEGQYTGDQLFLRKYLLPFADMILIWWDQHWSMNEQGQLDMSPSQSLETYWGIKNPTPDIAGLLWTLKELLNFPEDVFDKEHKQFWQNLLKKIPPLPKISEKGIEIIPPSYPPLVKRTNSENPELYCIFPYRIFGIHKPELELARNTFYQRHSKQSKGWNQDDFQAACLGLTKDARKLLQKRCFHVNRDSRFPVFWGPNFDWIPDQDHGSGILITLQNMLLQCDNEHIYLFPAWPKKWNVEFKLWAAKRTCIEGKLQNGKVIDLKVTPPERQKDLIICNFN
jgi:alpha-L-fucosidase 2